MTTARLFLAPMICALSGLSFDHALRWSNYRLLDAAPAGSDRDQFLCGIANEAQDSVRIIARQEASAQMMLAQADVLVEIRAGVEAATCGALVRCLRF